ncbi:low temperature requirement protein A [Micromonospora sp. NPDC051141]|uniref:low temperature requirement protein A n=1 Tax=Micromonospora sp. NPDC051141 TaxID=3364284 RepID=UPI0037AB0EA7
MGKNMPADGADVGWRRRLLVRSGSAPEQALRAGFLELFFDLVFVFALIRIVARSFEDLAQHPGATTWQQALPPSGRTLLLLLALLGLWQSTYWTTSRYNPDSIVTQAAVATALVAALVMGVVTPKAYEGYAVTFAVAYIAGRLVRPLALALSVPNERHRALKHRMLVVYSITGVLWLGGAFVGGATQAPLWAVALAIELAASRTGWSVPWGRREDLEHWDITAEHLAERYQQFFLVALGETILAIGLTYSAVPFDFWHTSAFAIATCTTILLWRLYYYRAGRIFADAIAQSSRPSKISRSATDIHLIIIIGVVTTALGYEVTISHPTGRAPAEWIVPIVLGPAVFVIGRARLEKAVFDRISPARYLTIAALLLPIPILIHAPPIVAAATGAVALFAAAIADIRRARAGGQPLETAKPPY